MMPIDRLCLNVWLRREQSEFEAYFPEARARYKTIVELLECEGPMKDALHEPNVLSPRKRDDQIGQFVSEEKLWAALCKALQKSD